MEPGGRGVPPNHPSRPEKNSGRHPGETERPAVLFFLLVGKDGFRDSLLGLFDEFSRNGLDPDTYQRILMNWNREGALRNKDMDLAKLYLVYSTLVSGQKLEDLSQSYARAAKVLEEGGSVPWQQCFFSEFYQLDPVQLRLLKALGRCCPVEMGLFYDPNGRN